MPGVESSSLLLSPVPEGMSSVELVWVLNDDNEDDDDDDEDEDDDDDDDTGGGKKEKEEGVALWLSNCLLLFVDNNDSDGDDDDDADNDVDAVDAAVDEGGGPAILSNTVLIRLPRKEIEVCQCYWRSELVTMGDKWGRKKREMCHFIGEMG